MTDKTFENYLYGAFKTCTKCFKEKLTTDFSNSQKHADGKQASCKRCHADYRMENLNLHKERNAKTYAGVFQGNGL